ncbi:unnamed protein product [Chondrus crispus]|uniref:Vacuolar protein sorting-associated protein 54 C-terminal domain-containing protein n=1 Tax=Chondrus crispus TaxID=2769 RepID=R7Q983_CHOCR|nr:unnamed protein product [Chondrus crispus]CDF33946.1 unnamed protein product [Chondrus crispus]|eukprot:XP_005713765.1 unnamed protein product [Chondrus crispus]
MGRLPLLRGFFLKEIKTELAKELKVVDALYAACNEVKISAEQALTLITIIRNYRQADADEEEDVSALLRDVHDDFEEMLASAVDRFLGSFKMSHETGLSAGFVVITPMELLTEQTCFDEFKAALKFGEQVRSLEEAATQLEAMFSLEKRSSLLRAKISERHNAFLSSFHRAHIETLTRTVKADKWQETRSPKGALRLLASLVDDGSGKEDAQLHESGNRIEQAPNGVLAPQPRDGLDGTVVIGEATFKTVTSGIRYLRSVCAYTLLAEKSPRLASEIARKATEFSRLFNSLVGKAILGAAALQWSGLRSITARHLSLASRTVAMAAALADRIDKPLAKALSASQVGVVLPLIQRAEKDLRDHHGQLLAKILTIMMDRLEAHEAVLKSLPWEKFMEMKRFDMPSAYITTLVKEATVLHRILWSILPTTEVCDIFTRVCAAYGSHLTEAYSSLDGGKEWVRSRVAEDVSCMHDRLLLLDVFKTNPDAFGPVRKLYTRFAKELQESAPNKQGNSKTGRSFIRSQQDQTDKPSAVKLLKPADRTTDATEEAANQPKHPLSSKDNANSGDFLTPAKPQDVSKASVKTEDARESPGKAGIADGSIPDARAEEKVEDDKLQARNEESENSSTSAVAEPANNSSPDAGVEEKVHHKESQARNEDLGNISNGVAEPAKISNLLDSEVQSEDKGMVAGEQFGSDDETQTTCASIVVDEKPLPQSAGSPSQHVAESRAPYDESESKSRTTTLSAEQRQLNEVMGLPDGGVSDETKMETREQEDVTELTTNDTKIVSNGRPLEPSPAQVPEGDLLGLGDDDPNTAGR